MCMYTCKQYACTHMNAWICTPLHSGTGDVGSMHVNVYTCICIHMCIRTQEWLTRCRLHGGPYLAPVA